MAKLLKLRRGTTTQHGSFTGAEGEVTIDTDKESLVVHNGSTAGGFPIARADGTGVTNFTITGELDAATLDISGNADIDGTLEADAYTVNGTALDEYIADTVGSMVGSNTETNIAVTYEDSDNTLDFVIGTLNQDTTGTAAIATTVTVADESSDTSCNVLYTTAATGNLGPKSGTNLTFNSSSGVLTATGFAGPITGNSTGTHNGPVDTADDEKLLIGTGDDLEIFHGSNESKIINNTGSLWLQSDTGIRFTDAGLNESMAAFYDNGAVELYHDGTKKFETTSGGVSVTGNVVASNDVEIPNDSGKIKLGTGTDLQIYHNGSDSYISDTGTGDLKIKGSVIKVLDTNDNAILTTATDGGITVKYNNSTKLAVVTGGVDVTGALTASGNVTAYSDARLKTDVDTIENALEKVTKLRGVEYTKADTQERGIGVIAQEVEEIIPEVVQDGAYKSVAYGNMVGVLIEAIKELKTEVNDLKAQLDKHTNTCCGGK